MTTKNTTRWCHQHHRATNHPNGVNSLVAGRIVSAFAGVNKSTAGVDSNLPSRTGKGKGTVKSTGEDCRINLAKRWRGVCSPSQPDDYPCPDNNSKHKDVDKIHKSLLYLIAPEAHNGIGWLRFLPGVHFHFLNSFN